MTTMPNGERIMWGIGFRLTWPPSKAVRSPPHMATREWAASWQVVENRKARYQMAPSAMSGVFNVKPSPDLKSGVETRV